MRRLDHNGRKPAAGPDIPSAITEGAPKVLRARGPLGLANEVLQPLQCLYLCAKFDGVLSGEQGVSSHELGTPEGKVSHLLSPLPELSFSAEFPPVHA